MPHKQHPSVDVFVDAYTKQLSIHVIWLAISKKFCERCDYLERKLGPTCFGMLRQICTIELVTKGGTLGTDVSGRFRVLKHICTTKLVAKRGNN